MKSSVRVLAALAAMWCLGGEARAAIEIGDAGSLPGTAQTISTSGPISPITGRLDSLDDVDVYRIHIEDLFFFSASIESSATDVLDTTLLLFNADGQAVIGNDDDPARAPPFQYHSLIPEEKLTGGPGTYFLAISVFPVRPVNGTTELFFDTFDDDLLLRRASDLPVTGWAPTPNPDIEGRFGAYQINLTGATGVTAELVPEPSSLAAFAVLLGISAAGFRLWRRA